MILQNYFIKRKIQTILRGAGRKSRFCSLSEANSFFISFNIHDKEPILKCVERLVELDKEIHLCVVIPRKPKKAVYETDPSWLVVKEDELDSKGLPSAVVRDAFDSVNADILIDLTREGDYVMHYLQLLHPASFKVGSKSSLRNLFDLTVTMGEDDDIPKFFEHVLYYLRTIRSN